MAKSFVIHFAQSLHRVAALGDRLCGQVDGVIEFLLSILRARRKKICGGLKAKQESLETLQQRIVEVPSDARAFFDARLQGRAKFAL